MTEKNTHCIKLSRFGDLFKYSVSGSVASAAVERSLSPLATFLVKKSYLRVKLKTTTDKTSYQNIKKL